MPFSASRAYNPNIHHSNIHALKHTHNRFMEGALVLRKNNLVLSLKGSFESDFDWFTWNHFQDSSFSSFGSMVCLLTGSDVAMYRYREDVCEIELMDRSRRVQVPSETNGFLTAMNVFWEDRFLIVGRKRGKVLKIRFE